MKIQVLFFGRLTEIAGSTLEMENIDTTNNLAKALAEKFPALAGEKYMMAVNRKMITTDITLEDNNTVALLPPFSGG